MSKKLRDTVNGITVETEAEGYLRSKRMVMKLYSGKKKIKQILLWRKERDLVEQDSFSKELHEKVVRQLKRDVPVERITDAAEMVSSKVNKRWDDLHSLLRAIGKD